MNKFGVVLGIAAVATLAGCKDPDFKRGGASVAQTEVKSVDTAPAKPVAIEPAPAPKCKCAPGTKHTAPCTCGAPDCKCIVETKPVVVADVSKAPVEPEYTIYVVQNGDYLAKISKKFNVTISSIKRLNPSIKKDIVRVGQKLKLPGKIDVGVQAAPVAATVTAVAAKKSAKKIQTSYTGATKEYVVKNGDTLGSIAYGNGINIRQLKELNSLTSDSLKIGQKLKIPAEKAVKAAKAANVAAPAEKKAAVAATAKKAVAPAEPVKEAVASAEPAKAVEPAEAAASVAEVKETISQIEAGKPAESAAAETTAAADAAEPAKAESAATTTYVVQEGDDMTGVSIRWGVSAAQIRELNTLAEGDRLVPGQIIKLPADAQQ